MKIINFFIKRMLKLASPYIYYQMKQIEEKEINLRNEDLKKQFKSCGEGVGLWGKSRITGVENIILGNNVHISENSFIRGEGGLTIGENTIISRNLVLYTMNHNYNGERLPYDERVNYKPVSIGKNVWIGMNVCITPGTIIHDGVIVGMGTVVSGEVPALTIIGGQKWRILGYRDRKHYDELNILKAFSGVNGTLYNWENKP